MKKAHSTRGGGFTLIELMVVVAIIALLSVIVLAALGNSRSKGLDSKIMEQMSSLRNAADIYYISHFTSYAATSVTGTASCLTPVHCATGVSDSVSPDLISNTVFADTTSNMLPIIVSLANMPGITMNGFASTTGWAVIVSLPSNPSSNGYWCADSTGKSKGEPSALLDPMKNNCP